MSQRPTTKGWFFVWLKEARKALAAGEINANAFAVLVVLSQCADYDTGANARPGVEYLSRMTRLAPRTVSEALKAGVAAGLIHQERRGFGNAGAGSPSVYRMEGLASAGASATAPANDSTLPSIHRVRTERTKSHQADENSDRPLKVRRVKRRKAQAVEKSSDAAQNWGRFGLSADEANQRGLTQVDFNNWVLMEEEKRGHE
jgi:hypothetical protein